RLHQQLEALREVMQRVVRAVLLGIALAQVRMELHAHLQPELGPGLRPPRQARHATSARDSRGRTSIARAATRWLTMPDTSDSPGLISTVGTPMRAAWITGPAMYG